jgi:hypothetical protein
LLKENRCKVFQCQKPVQLKKVCQHFISRSYSIADTSQVSNYMYLDNRMKAYYYRHSKLMMPL